MFTIIYFLLATCGYPKSEWLLVTTLQPQHVVKQECISMEFLGQILISEILLYDLHNIRQKTSIKGVKSNS